MIFLPEFSANTNLKCLGDCCVSRFRRCGMNGALTVAPSTVIRFQTKTVLLRFQNDLRPHLLFSYRFCPSTLQRRSREMPHGSVCPPFWILTVEWSGAWWCLFDDVTVFSPSTLENSVFKNIVFKLLHSGERFRMAPFSMIGFGVVVWTIVVSGEKQLRLRLKTD